jgi:hypothetical protein
VIFFNSINYVQLDRDSFLLRIALVSLYLENKKTFLIFLVNIDIRILDFFIKLELRLGSEKESGGTAISDTCHWPAVRGTPHTKRLLTNLFYSGKGNETRKC